MTSQVVGLVSRAIVRLVAGDKAGFEELAGTAEREHQRDRHLYLTVREILEEESECIS
jgi:hypothetical protein